MVDFHFLLKYTRANALINFVSCKASIARTRNQEARLAFPLKLAVSFIVQINLPYSLVPLTDTLCCLKQKPIDYYQGHREPYSPTYYAG